MADFCVKCNSLSQSGLFTRWAVSEIDTLVLHWLSIHQASDLMYIHHWHYAHWKETMKVVNNVIEHNEDLTFNVSTEVKQLHQGFPSSMTVIKN